MKTENELWYGVEIEPALQALAAKCAERGMAFTAVVEFAPGEERGEVSHTPEQCGLAMTWLRMLAATGNNIDRFMFSVGRHCREHNIDTSASIVMRMMR